MDFPNFLNKKEVIALANEVALDASMTGRMDDYWRLPSPAEEGRFLYGLPSEPLYYPCPCCYGRAVRTW